MNWAIIIAILSPFLFAFMNTFDKFVVAHKIKSTLGYSAVTGIVNILFGLILIFVLKWDTVASSALLFPVIAGIFSGVCYYLYFFIMKDSDASYIIGFAYLYPIIIAVLSFIFLHEHLPFLAYFGSIIIIIGIVMLSVRAKKIKAAIMILPLLIYILFIAGYEFFIKLSTNNVSFMQGLSITILVSGITVLFGLFSKSIRHGFKIELKNICWAFFSEFFTVIAVLTLYFAMSRLPATIVASIASTQPLAVLIFERIVHAHVGKMTKDKKLGPKLIAISLIVVGVIILSILSS